jgi:hypothetical protein
MPDNILATGHLDFWLLVIGLFLPRFALFLAWAGVFPYPPNALPEIGNFILWLIFPRFLIAFYIYTDIGYMNVWFWAYLVLGIVGCFGESNFTQRRIIRRKTIRDGNRVTTIEEEEVE